MSEKERLTFKHKGKSGSVNFTLGQIKYRRYVMKFKLWKKVLLWGLTFTLVVSIIGVGVTRIAAVDEK
jgi:hypothetical protein